MARNIEIKAHARQPHEPSVIAEQLSAELSETIEQTDVFFRTGKGRLKLRVLSPGEGVLIFYDRPDQTGPKLSTYSVSSTDSPSTLRAVLSAAYGEDIVVRKVRTILLLGRTRIHLDKVEKLGDFIELEVVLEDGESIADGMEEAHAVMNKLGIGEADLIDGAYADLLRART